MQRNFKAHFSFDSGARYYGEILDLLSNDQHNQKRFRNRRFRFTDIFNLEKSINLHELARGIQPVSSRQPSLKSWRVKGPYHTFIGSPRNLGQQPKLELHCQEDQVNYNQNTNPKIQKHSVFYFSKKNELKAKTLFFLFMLKVT